MYTLVKDFQDYQFVYFWLENRKVVSPKLPTMEHAKEWFRDLHFGNYEGTERRKCKLDRRKNVRAFYSDSEIAYSRIVPSSRGRRCCDKHIKVDLDYSEAKISRLKTAE
ncbi:MAG: hypothetical protein ACPF9K_00610 [Neptuniibacter sp.]